MFLVKFLFIAIVILWVIRLLIRLIFPMMLRNMFGNIQQQQAQQQQQQQPNNRKPEGSVSIDYMPQQEKKGNADKLGDFVDYEEIK